MQWHILRAATTGISSSARETERWTAKGAERLRATSMGGIADACCAGPPSPRAVFLPRGTFSGRRPPLRGQSAAHHPPTMTGTTAPPIFSFFLFVHHRTRPSRSLPSRRRSPAHFGFSPQLCPQPSLPFSHSPFCASSSAASSICRPPRQWRRGKPGSPGSASRP